MKKEWTSLQKTGLFVVIAVLFTDMIMYSLLVPITPYIDETYQPSATMMGALFSTYAVGLLIATPFLGRLSDQIGRKIPMLLGIFALIIATLLFIVADQMWMLIVARFIQGIAAGASWTAGFALLADLFPGKSRGPIMGFALSAVSAGTLLGAPVGGWLFQVGGYQLPFIVTIVCNIFILLVTLFFLKEPKRASSPSQSGILSLLKVREIRWITAVILIGEGIITMLEPVLPVYAANQLGMGAQAIGLFFGVMTIAYGISSPISGAISSKYNPYPIMMIGLFWMALSLPFLVISTSVWILVFAGIALGGAAGFALSPTLAALGEVVDDNGGDGEEYGTAYAFFNMLFAFAMIIGPLLGGALTDVMTVPNAIYTSSLLMIVAASSLVIRIKKQRRRMESE
ncbi:MFS transporter [Bacillus sp. REN10]|uniref:MFS transporter n=1 Tax=Bacillus sp. REN10 TaxID=2782541 RepID=UPI00193BBC0B|nr:MFS transporter [Bacillus sp. REN10]